MNQETPRGQNITVGSQFFVIGSNNENPMKLKDLVPGGNWGINDTIKTFSPANGAVALKAVYITPSKLATAQKVNPNAKVAWYRYYPATERSKMYTEEVGDTVLPFGQGVLAVSSSTGSYITSSGEVMTGDENGMINIALNRGENVLISNCTPIDRKLKEIKCGGNWGINDTIKIFSKANGAVEYKAVYITESKLATAQKINPNAKVGWYVYYPATERAKMYTESLDEIDIPAGTGMLVVTSSAGSTISIPAAL